MKKLHAALEVGAYYDDELVELQHKHDDILEQCKAARQKQHFRPPVRQWEEEEDKQSTRGKRGDPSIDPSSFPTRKPLMELMQKLVMPPDRSPPVPLLAERARREVVTSAHPGHELEAARVHLLAFFERRRARLTLQCDLITGRLRRQLRGWATSRRLAPVVQGRLRLLNREIEAADLRTRRLSKPRSAQCWKQEVLKQPEELRPIPKAGTGVKLFSYNETFESATVSNIFRGDVAVCLREMVWQDRTTRLLRHFMLQKQHLPLTHRQEIWRSTVDLHAAASAAAAPTNGCAPLPLTWVLRSQAFEERIQVLARSLGIQNLLKPDGGHALAATVITRFAVVFSSQSEQMDFKPYETCRPETVDEAVLRIVESSEGDVGRRQRADSSSSVTSSTVEATKDLDVKSNYLLESGWLDCVLLQPRVSLSVQEQRALMRGCVGADGAGKSSNSVPNSKHNSVSAKPSGTASLKSHLETHHGINSDLKDELEFLLHTDAVAVEREIRQLAGQRAVAEVPEAAKQAIHAARAAKAALGELDEEEVEDALQEDDALDSLEQAPEHQLCTYYLLRHLHGRSLRRQLLSLLNLFRFAQQKVAHGALTLQAGATSKGSSVDRQGETTTDDIPKQKQDYSNELHIGQLPPSLPYAWSVVRRGIGTRPLCDCLAALSDAERLVPNRSSPLQDEEVIDGQGVRIMHGAALADLQAVEQELLLIGSYALRKGSEEAQKLADTGGLLVELLECEVSFLRAKWKLVEVYVRAFERVSDPSGKWDLAQRVVDIMAQRPCFDLQSDTDGFAFAEAYAAASAAAMDRAAFLKEVVDHQVRTEDAASERLARQELTAQRSGSSVEHDLGHQRERSAAFHNQPSQFARQEMEDIPHLSLEDQLAHPLEGYPPARAAALPAHDDIGLLDFCDSCALASEVDILVEEASTNLSEALAPEPRYRHHIERACVAILAREWAQQVAAAAPELPGLPNTYTSLRLSSSGSDEAKISPIFWGSLADDADWLMLQAEEIVQSWEEPQDSMAPGSLRPELDPELEIVPHAEAVLRLSCRLMDQVRVRRLLLDAVAEMRALETGLTRQAQLVGTVANLGASDSIPDFHSDFLDEPPQVIKERSSPLLAAEVMSVHHNLDLSRATGIRTLLRPDRLQELRLLLQHQLAGKWLAAGCMLYNTILLDGFLRQRIIDDEGKARAEASNGRHGERQLPEAAKSTRELQRMRAGSMLSRPWLLASRQEPNEMQNDAPVINSASTSGKQRDNPVTSKAKILAASMQWPGPPRTAVCNAVGASMREHVRTLRRKVDELPHVDARMCALVLYRNRALAYSSLFILERACDLCVRAQAGLAALEMRSIVSVLPGELSPFKLSSAENTRTLVEIDGSVTGIFNLPTAEELLGLRGTDCPNVARVVRDSELHLMPDPFPVLGLLGTWKAPDGPCDTPAPRQRITVGMPDSVWTLPKFDISFSGTANLNFLILRELAAITSLSLQAASLSASQLIILGMHHAAEAAPLHSSANGGSADLGPKQRAVRNRLSPSMLGPIQMDDMERYRKPQTDVQIAWDALQSIRADFFRLESQVKALKEEQGEVRSVLALLKQRRTCAELRLLTQLQQAGQEAVKENCLHEAAELQRWELYLEGFPLEGGTRLVSGAGALREALKMPKNVFPKKDDSPRRQTVTESIASPVSVSAFERTADTALESLAMAAPSGRRPWLAGPVSFAQLGDQRDEVQGATQPRLPPEVCSHYHPLFHALVLLLSRPTPPCDPLGACLGDDNAAYKSEFEYHPSPGRAVWNLPSLPLRFVPRALCLLPTKRRDVIAERQQRLELQCDFLRGRGSWDDPETQEEELAMIQTLYLVNRLRVMAMTFILLRPPTRTPEGWKSAEEMLAAELRRRDEDTKRKNEAMGIQEEAAEETEDSSTARQQEAMERQAALDVAIRAATAMADAANAAAEAEGDLLLLARGGPGAAKDHEEGRTSTKESITEACNMVAHLVGIIFKCSLRFGASAVQRLLGHLESQSQSEGGKAVQGFAQHLLSRATRVETFCKDSNGAWLIKNCDIDESMEQVGRLMLQWAIVTTADQVVSARERVTSASQRLQQLEEKLLQARLALRLQRGEIDTTLSTMVADRGQREIFEIDKLNRSHRSIAAAAYEVEHRLGVDMRQSVLQELTSLDKELVKARSRFSKYRGAMLQGVQNEMTALRTSLLNQMQKIADRSFAMAAAMKKVEKDPRWQGTEDFGGGEKGKLPTLQQSVPLYPHSANRLSVSATHPLLEQEASEELMGPGRPPVRPGGQPERAAHLEGLHTQIGELNSVGTRVNTFYRLKFQQLRQHFEEEIHRISATISSNSKLWENVSEARERQRLLSEEIVRSQRRRNNAVDNVGMFKKDIAEHNEHLQKTSVVKRRLGKEQARLSHEMGRYEKDGLVDVAKIESELGKLDSRIQQLSTVVPADVLVAAVKRRDGAERRRLKLQMRFEGSLLQKSAAKVQVIRTELEKGHEDEEEEPLLDLLMEECTQLAKQAEVMTQENEELQDSILRNMSGSSGQQKDEHSGGNRISLAQQRSSLRGDRSGSRSREADQSFEEDLCFSVSFIRTPRGVNFRKQIDQTHGGASLASDRRPSGGSMTPRAAYPGSAVPDRLPPAIGAKPPMPPGGNFQIRSQPLASGSSLTMRLPQHLSPVPSTEALHRH
eukprot:TRINITY_DN25038_c0_g1_i1.p1 TRINITY_DN25038_c0_g1~~TRINITY_DN25038_c0_g1_i1.p1  ORF type:complete len:2677 (-),score=547.60 TRINITY_DN25038_c0_g1_i1:62-8092(-)